MLIIAYMHQSQVKIQQSQRYTKKWRVKISVTDIGRRKIGEVVTIFKDSKGVKYVAFLSTGKEPDVRAVGGP